MERFDFPELVDNTQRSAFIKCPTLWARAHGQHLASLMPNIHLHAGGALASAFEVVRRAFYQLGTEPAEAMRRGLETLITKYGDIKPPPAKSGDKSVDTCIRALDSYFTQYPLAHSGMVPYVAPNGQAMLEFSFAIPTEIKHPVTGNPILYGGRSDMVGVQHEALWVVDEKTTGSLGEQWMNQWQLDSQPTGYIYAAHQHGLPVAGAIMRGIGMLKTKITHAECIVHRGQWQLDRWWEQLHHDLTAMIDAWERHHYDQRLSKDACASYGACPMVMLCGSPTPDQWIPSHYRIHHWNPLEADGGEHLLENEALMAQLQMPELSMTELMNP